MLPSDMGISVSQVREEGRDLERAATRRAVGETSSDKLKKYEEHLKILLKAGLSAQLSVRVLRACALDVFMSDVTSTPVVKGYEGTQQFQLQIKMGGNIYPALVADRSFLKC